MAAFGYVRKSVMADATKTLSPQVQEERVRSLAAAHGDDDLTIFSDLDVSGAKVAERPGYLRLVEAIESGEAHAIYAYDLSRLHRNVREALRFFELAAKHDVPVRLVADSVDTSTATGRMVLTILASVNAMISEVASEKIKASLAMKRAGGWKDGGRLYGTREGEDVAAVVDAFRTTESPLRAARLLNAEGVPTRNPRSRGWSPSAVRSVVRRHAPELLRDPANAGAPGSRGGERHHRFARLLRCSVCGALLTPSVDLRQGATRYYCHAAGTTPHGRKTITEAAITKVVVAELEHLDWARPKRVRQGSASDEAQLAELDAKRARYVEMYGEGLVDRATRDAKLAEVTEAESKLSATRWMMEITLPPTIVDIADEDGVVVLRADDPATVNGYLRRVFSRITVDMSVPGRRGVPTPAAATFAWRDPTLRIEDIDDTADDDYTPYYLPDGARSPR